MTVPSLSADMVVAPARRGLGFRLTAAWLVLPAALFLTAIYLYPLFEVFWLSVDGAALNLAHFAAFFGDPALLRVMGNTFELAFWTTVFCLILGYPTAYVLARAPARWRGPLLLLVVVPYMTSFLVRTYAWTVLLNDQGLVNSALQWLGVVDEPVKLLYNRTGVYIGTVHIMLPMMVMALFSVMQGIDLRLERASASLGASPWRTFLRVYLPLSLPGVRSGSLLVFLVSLGFYATPILLGGLNDRMLVNIIDAQIGRLGNWAFGASASVVLLVVTLIGIFLVGRLAGGADLFELGQGTAIAKRSGGKPTLVARLLAPLGRNALVRSLGDALARRRAARWRGGVAAGRSLPPVGRWGLRVVTALVLLFLALPSFIVVPISFSSASLLAFPPPGWSLRWYETFFTRRGWLESAYLSLGTAFATMVFATILGTLAAYGLVRGRLLFKRTLMSIVISPIIVPPIVIGIGLYGMMVSTGMRGTWYGLVAAHSIGAMAYVIVIVSATFARFDFALERAALSLGASPVRTFLKVTLPLIRPGVIAGAVFAFLHSFDELVITMLVAGVAKTLPLRMWENIRAEINPTIAAASTLMLMLTLACLVVLTLSGRSRGR